MLHSAAKIPQVRCRLLHECRKLLTLSRSVASVRGSARSKLATCALLPLRAILFSSGLAVQCNGVRLSASLAFTSIRRSARSCFTTSEEPLNAAQCKGVDPSYMKIQREGDSGRDLWCGMRLVVRDGVASTRTHRSICHVDIYPWIRHNFCGKRRVPICSSPVQWRPAFL